MNEELETEMPKRGPGRPPKVQQTQDHDPEFVEKIVRRTHKITYLPGDGDPVRTKWNGIEFKAHIPVEISASHTILVPVRHEHQQADGTIITRALEKRIPMVELARTNPSFSVDGETPISRKVGTARTPTNSDEYRGWAINWIHHSTGPSTMDARWDGEADLREKCGCDDKDIAYLRPFFEAKREIVGGQTAA